MKHVCKHSQSLCQRWCQFDLECWTEFPRAELLDCKGQLAVVFAVDHFVHDYVANIENLQFRILNKRVGRDLITNHDQNGAGQDRQKILCSIRITTAVAKHWPATQKKYERCTNRIINWKNTMMSVVLLLPLTFLIFLVQTLKILEKSNPITYSSKTKTSSPNTVYEHPRYRQTAWHFHAPPVSRSPRPIRGLCASWWACRARNTSKGHAPFWGNKIDVVIVAHCLID